MIGGKIETFGRPLVMGILNVTSDSFHEASRLASAEEAARKAVEMLESGADILDLGACSTRPGSQSVSEEEELRRLEPALEAILRVAPDAVVSVDTFRSGVARRCVMDWGVKIINDISGGTLDPAMEDTVADLGCGYVLMHMRGTPETMGEFTDYDGDVVAGVMIELAFRLDSLRQKGVMDVIIDPGFGFAKTVEQNYRLLDRLPDLQELGAPILVGVSRKSMIFRPLEISPAEALPGTIALGMAAMMKGASILRVHDVAEAVQSVKVFELLTAATPESENVIVTADRPVPPNPSANN